MIIFVNLFLFLIIFFVLHMIIQRIIPNKFIINFVFLCLFCDLFLFIYLNLTEVIFEIKMIFLINILFCQFIYLIIIQAVRSSIQIYILKNYKSINLINFKKEDIKIFNKRMKNFISNKILFKKKNYLINNINLTLKFVYYFFYLIKKMYKEKF
jgi:hypothetical protein